MAIEGGTVRAVERVCDIVDLLRRTPGAVTLSDVAAATGLPKSSAHRYLATLETRRYVQRDPATGDYRAGAALLSLGTHWVELLRRRARPYLERLRGEFEETINLGVLDGHQVLYVEIVESLRGVRLAARRGGRDPLHSTALGKAICSTLSDEQVSALLAEAGMQRRTHDTIVTLRRYLDELAEVRTRGYAIDNGENEPDGRCIAVPLPGKAALAGLSLSAPAARFPQNRADEAAKALTAAAEELSRVVQASTTDIDTDSVV